MIKLIKIQTQLQKIKKENNIMRESCKSCQRGFNSDNFVCLFCFYLTRGERIQIPLDLNWLIFWQLNIKMHPTLTVLENIHNDLMNRYSV